jgi:hypothetical protein
MHLDLAQFDTMRMEPCVGVGTAELASGSYALELVNRVPFHC